MIENVKELKKGMLVHGSDGKVGEFYKKDIEGYETFITIKYGGNDYGMFNLDVITIVDNENK